MNKFLVVLVALMLCAGLVACAPWQPTEQNLQSTATPEQTSAPSAQPESAQTKEPEQETEAQVQRPQTPEQTLEYLISQNKEYMDAHQNDADISQGLRENLANERQSPYLTVLSCSDSRVVPEHIFMASPGDIFTVRNAGNVIDDIVMGSVEYGVQHLESKVVMVMGHTGCGAVSATISGAGHDHITSITQEVGAAIGQSHDHTEAEILNAQAQVSEIMQNPIVSNAINDGKIIVTGAIYDAHTGEVQLLEVPTVEVDYERLYDEAVLDSMVAEQDEVHDLVALIPGDDMTTWQDDKVLLLTWNKYPDSYPEGEEVTLSYGDVWTFTDREITAWYSEYGTDMEDVHMRFNQLIGLPPEDDNTHFTAFWVDPEDVVRPAYVTDATADEMTTQSTEMDEEFKTWFDGNIVSSYYEEYTYPWTRLGYTYDWANNGREYGLSEFLVKKDSRVEVEFTMTTQEFIEFMAEGA